MLNADFLEEIIIISFFSFLFGCFFKSFKETMQERRSGLTGKWKISIYNTREEIIKQDFADVKHRGKDVYGKIRRVIPDKRSYRKWEFIGKKHNDDVFIIFISNNESIPSSGCAHVHLKKDFRYEGFYFKIDEKNKIVPVKIVIEK